MDRKNLEKKAAAVWMRTGQPQAMLQSMTDDELNELLDMRDPDHLGLVAPGFREKIGKFIDKYFDSRKASVDPPPTIPEVEVDHVD